MAVDSATYIAQFNLALPDGAADDIAEGDNNFRHVKTVLHTQFAALGNAALSVTAAQVNDVVNKALIAGNTYTGTHTFTGATITVPTQTAGNSTTNAASTAFVAAGLAAIARLGIDLSTSIETLTAVTGLAGSRHMLRNVAATAVTTPASPTIGQRFGVVVRNGLTTNSITYGSDKIMGLAESLTLNDTYAAVQLVYTDATDGWVLE